MAMSSARKLRFLSREDRRGAWPVPGVHQEGRAGEDGDGGEDLDQAGVEPVTGLALIEYELQRAHSQDQ